MCALGWGNKVLGRGMDMLNSLLMASAMDFFVLPSNLLFHPNSYV